MNLADKWPSCNCVGENLVIHDYLCEILEAKGYSEADVCTASVGMWGAIAIMREKLDMAIRDKEMVEVSLKNLQADFDRVLKQSGEDLKELAELKRSRTERESED